MAASCSSLQLKKYLTAWSFFLNWERKDFKTACKIVRKNSLMNLKLFGFAPHRFPSQSVTLNVIYSAQC